MELEELKNIWHNDKGRFQPKDETQLASMLKGNSRSLVEKIKRNVWFELLVTFVAGIVMLLYAMNLSSGAIKWTTVSILVLFFAYTFYYIKKLLVLRQFKSGDDNIKANLEKLIETLSSYLKFYKRSYTILYPVYFALGILFGALEIGSDRFIQKVSDPVWVSYLLSAIIGFFFLSMLFAKWYLRKLYGEHLDKLKALLTELTTKEELEI